jgi:hypothetical protein
MASNKSVMLLMDVPTARMVREALQLFISNNHSLDKEEEDRAYAMNAELSKKIMEETRRP